VTTSTASTESPQLGPITTGESAQSESEKNKADAKPSAPAAKGESEKTKSTTKK
jgi:hypothetical protein